VSEAEPLLQAVGIMKAYPGTLALEQANLSVGVGEIHALMGENGAGKSTLIKILTGAEMLDDGSVQLAGKAVDLTSTKAAQRAGIWAVHQEVMTLPNLSIADNILLGYQPTRFGLVDRRKMRRLAQEALAKLGVALDVDKPLGHYSVAVRQLVAIARAARSNARLLVLDEPTASLDAPEVEKLFAVLRSLAADGTGIIFITHFLDQVYTLCDRISVLRNGRTVGSFTPTELPRRSLIELMIGKLFDEPVKAASKESKRTLPIALRASGLFKRGSVEPFDLTLHSGEAVGAVGLLGSGRTETAMLMFGAERPDGGSLEVGGTPTKLRSPRDAILSGMALTPEDRKVSGLFAELSIRENVIIALQAKRGWLRKLGGARQQRIASAAIARLDIRTTDADNPVGQLSGGNQQKALLARSLATEPDILILDEPTRGIDVGAHAEIMRMIAELRDGGMALYVISSELEELLCYADRLSVMHERRQIGMLEGHEVSVATIVSAIASAADVL
jgi:monosaccharide-transporting ATPase